MRTIDVNLTNDAYQVRIEPGLLHRLGRVALDVAPARRALLAVDANIASSHGPIAEQSLSEKGYHVEVHELVAEEPRKTLESVRDVYETMLRARLDRGSPVIALGGGVVGDVAGFAAATYMRGVPIIHVPTTLLAMVDASIGGKTGVNFPAPTPNIEGSDQQPSDTHRLMKNMIGAFWQPDAVLIDPQVLATLGARDLRCGLAECVKHALIADADLLTLLATSAASVAALEMEPLVDLI